MLDNSKIEIFYEWLVANSKHAEEIWTDDKFGVTFNQRIPYIVYATIKNISKEDDIDPILELFWNYWSTVKDYEVRVEEKDGAYSFIIDIEFEEPFCGDYDRGDPEDYSNRPYEYWRER